MKRKLTERQAFESYIGKRTYGNMLGRWDNGSYVHIRVKEDWRLWQASVRRRRK